MTLRAGVDQEVRGTVTDQNHLAAVATRSGLNVCDRCVTGASYAARRWVVHHGRRYTVAILGGWRPRFIAWARPGHTACLRPVASRRGDPVAGRTVWLFEVTAPTGRGQWWLSYRREHTTARIPLTVR